VPIDGSLRCVALVRGLPATRALMTTNDGATMVRLTWCKAMTAKRLEVVPAACLRHLRSLLKTRARHICAACLRQSCVLELPQCARPQILKQCNVRSYELRTPGAYSLVATDGFDQNATHPFLHCARVMHINGPGCPCNPSQNTSVPSIRPKYFLRDDGGIFCVPYA
jgi:hypothetical protein